MLNVFYIMIRTQKTEMLFGS